MSFDATDAFIGGVVSNCCGAKVLLGDMCADCGEGCEPEDEDAEEESQEGPTDAQLESQAETIHLANERYRKQMIDAGRGHLLP